MHLKFEDRFGSKNNNYLVYLYCILKLCPYKVKLNLHTIKIDSDIL